MEWPGWRTSEILHGPRRQGLHQGAAQRPFPCALAKQSLSQVLGGDADGTGDFVPISKNLTTQPGAADGSNDDKSKNPTS